MKMPSYIILLCAVILLAGCDKSINRYEYEKALIIAGSESLRIQNKLSQTLFYIVLEEEISTRVDIRVACDNLNYIEGYGSKIIPYDIIMGFKQGATVVFYTWICDESGSPSDLQRNLISVP